MNKPNFYICCGIDGAGKTTTLKALQKDLPDIFVTFEPYYDSYKELLTTIDNPMERGYIFTCDRIRHFNKVVLPALNQGKTVVMDRGHYCNIAYQTIEAMAYDGMYAFTLQKILERIQPAIPLHKVIWFYCDPYIAYERKHEFGPETLIEIQKMYKFILPKDRFVIDTSFDTPAETLQKVKDFL